jgi:hypothetical protein
VGFGEWAFSSWLRKSCCHHLNVIPQSMKEACDQRTGADEALSIAVSLARI